MADITAVSYRGGADAPADAGAAPERHSADEIRRRLLSDPARDRRRSANQKVRQARERLTSTTGTTPAFDLELTRLYAHNRLSSATTLIIGAIVGAAVLLVWVPPTLVALWLSSLLAAHLLILAFARRFLAQQSERIALKVWFGRFTFAEFCYAAVLAALVPLVGASPTDGPRLLVFFTLLLSGSVLATVAASLPLAIYAGTLPLTIMVVAFYWPQGGEAAAAIAIMAPLTQLFLIYLGQRLFRASLMALQFRAEKDALIGELEQANAHSDEARRRAEGANVAKSRFLATMSHELRTPLNAILGFSEVMKSEVFGPHANQTYKEYANDIHVSGQHLLNLINEILDLSRIEAGRYELNEEAVNLAHIVEDCRHLLKLRAQTRGLTIVEVYEPGLPLLWADERAVRQITLNLLSNAIKFTPQGGDIRLTVGWTEDGGQYLSVRDSGPGIPEEEIPVVLSSFGQGSLAQKTAEQGAGLGLPIVQGLVDLHGGTLALRSKLREGTEVFVTFPASRVMAALPPIDEQALPALRRRG